MSLIGLRILIGHEIYVVYISTMHDLHNFPVIWYVICIYKHIGSPAIRHFITCICVVIFIEVCVSLIRLWCLNRKWLPLFILQAKFFFRFLHVLRWPKLSMFCDIEIRLRPYYVCTLSCSFGSLRHQISGYCLPEF